MIPRVKPEGMLCGKPASAFPDHALAGNALQQVERAAEHEVEAACAPLPGGVAHQRRLFAVAAHDAVRAWRSRQRGDDCAALLGGGKLAERDRLDAYARRDAAGRPLGRLENMQARFRAKNAMGAESTNQQYRVCRP